MTAIVAECERCAGIWSVPADAGNDPDLLEGVCMDCQADSEVERPLTFRHWGTDRDIEYCLPEETLPEDWLL